jgi:hypothetical protein
MSLKGESRGERLEGDEVRRVHDHPHAARQFLDDHVAKEAPVPVLEVFAALSDFRLHTERDDRGHDELRVGVLQRGARLVPHVLEDQPVDQSRIPFEVEKPLFVEPEDVADLVVREPRQRDLVAGGLDDHLVRPHPVHEVVHAVAPF